MNTPPAPNASQGPPRIWEMPCLAIKVFLTHGMRTETLRAYMQGYCCELCEERMEDETWVLRMAHQACHSANPLSNRIEAQLFIRFREQIRYVRGASYLALMHRLAREGFTEFELVGVLWALHTDRSPGKRVFGRNLLQAMARESAPEPTNIIPWPGTRQLTVPRTDAHRWN